MAWSFFKSLFRWKAINFGSVKNYWCWFLPCHLEAVGLFSLPASVCLSIRPSAGLSSCSPACHSIRQACPRDNSANIFFNLFQTWLEYSLGKYLGQVRWWVSHLIWYGHNWLNTIFVRSCLAITLIHNLPRWVYYECHNHEPAKL